MGDTGSASGGGASPDSARPADAPGKSFEIELEGTPLGPLKGTVRLIEPPRGKPPSPWVTELPKAVITLITASVVGGLVSMAFNYKSWRENQRIDRARIDMAKAQATYSAINEMVARRIHHTYQLMRWLEDGVDPGDAEAVKESREVSASYRKTVDDWNGKIRLMVKQTEFDIDQAVAARDDVDRDMVGILYKSIREVKTIDCGVTFRPSANPPSPVDWSRASWVLAGVHVCFTQLTADFNPQRDGIEAEKASDKRKAMLAAHRKRLDSIQEQAMQYITRGGLNLRDARKQTQTRDFWEYIKDW
jgi:hypothetical protein